MNAHLRFSPPNNNFLFFSGRVHIRRTDKIGTEAAFHPIEEYMKHVSDWYDQQVQNGVEIDRRSIYLATDDPKVVFDTKKKLVKVLKIQRVNTRKTVKRYYIMK